MSEEVSEPPQGDAPSPSPQDDTRPIVVPPVGASPSPSPSPWEHDRIVVPPMSPAEDVVVVGVDAVDEQAPTGTYALGALAGNPLLGRASGAAFPPPPPAPPAPPYGSWPPPPVGGPPPAPRKGGAWRTAFAFGAAIVLLGAGVAIGHGAWQSPGQFSAAPASNSSGSGNSNSNSNSNNSGSGTGNSNNSGSGGFANPFGGNSPYGSGGGGYFGGGSGSGGSSSSVGAGPSDAASIASKVDPGLVDINTTLGYQSEQAAGTGMVLTSSGEILTNNHVIDGATTISVTDVGNNKTYGARVVGYDRTKDIAVLQLQGASGLQTANIGDSSNVSVGQQVVGIGNAGGTGGTPSYAGGTVTALNQSITASDEGDGTSEQLSGLIQTNANIQAGDSGGSLVDTSGQVIGIDTAASAGTSFQSAQGSSTSEGFAIPIATAISIAKQIEAGDSSSTVHIGETAFLGVEIESQSSANAGGNPFGFGGGSGNQSPATGAVIAGVVTSSPAQEAGLAQGDVITAVNGTSISTPNEVTNALETHHPGDKVSVTWTDTSGNSNTATVTLSSGPPE